MNDWYRQQVNERERRQEEQRQRDNAAVNDYWNHPTQGFWARMKQQDEHNRWLSEQDARRAYESWLRQQELAREMGNPSSAETVDAQRLDAGRRHDDLILQDELLKAYHGRFSEHVALASLWERAAEGKESRRDPFEAARSSFWELVNSDQSDEAQAVRRILEAAGFELQGEDRAPMLKIEGFDLQREMDTHRREHALRLSIDHIVAHSDKDRGERLRLEADNLRFMLFDDNRFRGNRWDENDQPLYEPRENLTRIQEEYRERVESMLRERGIEWERRQQEQRQRENAADYDYWWHPIQGFWAWMRRQGEYTYWRSEQEARRAYESWLRQQELAREERVDAQRLDPGRRHDDLVQLED